MYSFCDAFISGLSLLTLAGVLYLIRKAFKKHFLNIFSHMMLILIVFGLLSKYTNWSYNAAKHSAGSVLRHGLADVPIRPR